MSYELGKSVGRVGLNKAGTMFGHVSRFHNDSLSFMSYSLDQYFVPKEVVADARARGGQFYFMGNEFMISADELERAFKELGIWEKA